MITCSINVGPLFAKLRALGHATRRPMQELVTNEARLFISSSGKVPGIVQITPPHSKGVRGNAAKKQGENAVRRDLRRVYGGASALYGLIKQRGDEGLARAFWKLVQARNFAGASAIAKSVTGHELRESFDGGSAHRGRRDGRGRVEGREPSFFTGDTKGLEDYTRRTVGRVGIYVAGFNAAGLRLGAKGVPAWGLRHGSQFSGVSVKATNTSFFITISNQVPFGQEGTMYRMRYVLDYRGKALGRQLPFIIRKAVRAAGFAAVAS